MLRKELFLSVREVREGGEGGGGGGGGTYNPSPTIPSKGETNHYKNCNNGISNPFLGNIFGKQYVCEYFFDGDHQVKTVFEIQDFLLLVGRLKVTPLSIISFIINFKQVIKIDITKNILVHL